MRVKKRILAVVLGAGLFVGAASPALAWTVSSGHKCTGQSGPQYGCEGDNAPAGHTHNPNPGQ
jgi:hypothetical protein